jgi:hypothetical protein
MSRTTRRDVARFAAKESTPVDREKARAMSDQANSLVRFIEELCLTNDTLWDENQRLQAGIGTQMELVASLRGRVSQSERRVRSVGPHAMLAGESIDAELLDRLKRALVSAQNHRFLVANVELEDMETLVALLDRFARVLSPPPAKP